MHAKNLEIDVFQVYSMLTDSWWIEGIISFTINYYIHCQVDSGRSVVKVELWNMIRLCRNLQLQIVWNWLAVLVLFGRHSAIGSIYLLKTTKVSGNTERGSQMVIFLLYTFFFCVFGSPFVEVFVAGRHIRNSLRDFRVLFLVALWRWTEHAFCSKTPKCQFNSPIQKPFVPKHGYKWVWLLFLMRTSLQLLAMMASRIFRSPSAHSLGHTSRSEVGWIEIFYAMKSYVKCTVGSEKVIPPALIIAYTHPFSLDSRVSQVCFQFSFVCLVWFTGLISLVLPWHVSVARPCFDLKCTLLTF